MLYVNFIYHTGVSGNTIAIPDSHVADYNNFISDISHTQHYNTIDLYNITKQHLSREKIIHIKCYLTGNGTIVSEPLSGERCVIYSMSLYYERFNNGLHDFSFDFYGLVMYATPWQLNLSLPINWIDVIEYLHNEGYYVLFTFNNHTTTYDLDRNKAKYFLEYHSYNTYVIIYDHQTVIVTLFVDYLSGDCSLWIGMRTDQFIDYARGIYHDSYNSAPRFRIDDLYDNSGMGQQRIEDITDKNSLSTSILATQGLFYDTFTLNMSLEVLSNLGTVSYYNESFTIQNRLSNTFHYYSPILRPMADNTGKVINKDAVDKFGSKSIESFVFVQFYDGYQWLCNYISNICHSYPTCSYYNTTQIFGIPQINFSWPSDFIDFLFDPTATNVSPQNVNYMLVIKKEQYNTTVVIKGMDYTEYNNNLTIPANSSLNTLDYRGLDVTLEPWQKISISFGSAIKFDSRVINRALTTLNTTRNSFHIIYIASNIADTAQDINNLRIALQSYDYNLLLYDNDLPAGVSPVNIVGLPFVINNPDNNLPMSSLPLVSYYALFIVRVYNSFVPQ